MREDHILPALLRLLRVPALWCTRARERRQLAELEDHSLADIGVTRDAALREARRPPWSGSQTRLHNDRRTLSVVAEADLFYMLKQADSA